MSEQPITTTHDQIVIQICTCNDVRLTFSDTSGRIGEVCQECGGVRFDERLGAETRLQHFGR